MKTRLKKYYQFLFKQHKRKTWFVLLFLSIIYWQILPNPLFNNPTSYVLEDKDGNLLGARITTDGQWRFPETDKVPDKFAKAIVAFEDKRFWYHPGIDPIGIGRAIKQNIQEKSVVSGGSTITMQVIRLSRKGKSRNLWEKFIEAILATRLEIGYKKSSILKLYASHAPFGGNVVGIDAASWRYFGKSAELLSWSEAATLAVLPNAPALIHPGRNRAALEAKRNRLLDKLLAKGDIDSTTCQLAKTEPIPEKPLPLPQLAPHLLDRAFANFRKGNNEKTRVKTTIDKNLQQRVNQIALRHHISLSGNGIHNIAALIIDTKTGETLAYLGNVEDENSAENHGQDVDIITASRSTGSVLKPFLYAFMLDEGLITPTALVPDIPTQLHNYRPENYKQTYDGAVPAKMAISRSLNVPLIRMLQQYGLEKFHFNLQNLGMTTIKKNARHYGLPLILGGAEGNLWELTSIYASMGRTLENAYTENGLYNPNDFRNAHYLLEKDGRHFKSAFHLPKEKWIEEPPKLSTAAIYAAFEAMLEVERPAEDGSWEIFQSKKRIAWKTGTSFGFRDAWAIGVTPQYTVGVWVGNADGEGRPDLVGVKAAAPILFDIFDILKTPKWFDPPYDEMVEMPICAESGFREKSICEHIDTVLMPKTCERSAVCPYHKTVHFDNKNNRVHGNCVTPSQMIHKSWFVLPPVEEFYYKTNNPNYQVLPAYRPDCQAKIASDNPMRLIYPNQNNMKIFVPIELDGTLGKTVFAVAHRKPNTTIYWHLDNEYLGSTETFHELELRPEPGKHQLTLVDESGNSVGLSFEILDREN